MRIPKNCIFLILACEVVTACGIDLPHHEFATNRCIFRQNTFYSKNASLTCSFSEDWKSTNMTSQTPNLKEYFLFGSPCSIKIISIESMSKKEYDITVMFF
mmetsp:Transcript_447/g.978  ORF Transcript_447/g.978 Transcript_447/m.978 type:complete len:101 (+) Transcript_447:1178-1480(+)